MVLSWRPPARGRLFEPVFKAYLRWYLAGECLRNWTLHATESVPKFEAHLHWLVALSWRPPSCGRLFEPSLKLHCVPLISVWVGSKHTGDDTWRFLGDQQSVDVSVSSMWTPDGNAASDADGKWMLGAYWRVHWVSVSQVSELFRQHSIVWKIDFNSWAEFTFQGTSGETKFLRGADRGRIVHYTMCICSTHWNH